MKRFKSTDGEIKRVALTSGHVFLIGDSWTPLPEFAWSAAYGSGCISEDMITGTNNIKAASEVMSQLNNIALVKAELRDIVLKGLKDNDQEMFNIKTGKPKISSVKEKLGKDVNSHLLDEVWYSIQEEIE